MNNLLQRILTGIVLTGLIIGTLLAGFYFFSLFFLFISLVGLFEFYRMAAPKVKKRDYFSSLFAGAAIYVICALTAAEIVPFEWLELLIPICAWFFLVELYKNREKPFENVGLTVLGLIYITLPFSLLNYMAFLPFGYYNYELVLGIFLFLWVSDSGAYVVGRLIGRTKLFERISPNKTIEGSVGGILAALLLAWFAVQHMFDTLDGIDWLVVAAIVSVSGIYGDLIESLLKRSFGRKDSGSLLPGHGGVLDRFDSLILSAPMVYAYIRLIQVW
ncbi:MAG: phosphatidate cytidylyltransferase [Bacteroidia bacterium]